MAIKIAGGRRIDPFRGFRFRVNIDGFEEAGFTTVSGLADETEVVEYREGDTAAGHMHKLPGLTSYDDIVLSKGKASDTVFQRWRNQVHQATTGRGLPDPNFRKSMIIELRNFQNQSVKTWNVLQAWPSRLEHEDLDASSSDVWVERLTIVHEGLVSKGITI